VKPSEVPAAKETAIAATAAVAPAIAVTKTPALVVVETPSVSWLSDFMALTKARLTTLVLMTTALGFGFG
jgi:hypothetical protein